MNRLLPLTGSIAIAFSLSGASSQEAPSVSHSDRELAGEWQGEVSASGTLARMNLTLYGDGTYVKRVVFVNDFGWTAEGSNLFIAPIARSGDSLLYGRAMRMEMKVGDSVLVTRSGKDSLKLHRTTWAVEASPLLGRWQGQTEFGEELTEDFTADGKLVVTITLAHEAGRYSVNKGTIEWWQQIPNPGKRHEKFEIDGDKLKVFAGPKLPPMELTRVGDQLVLK